MRIKSCPVQIKAAGPNEGTEEGVFEAIVAAYNLDSVGDKIVPGAFAETLAEWAAKGDPIPVLWSHLSHDPDYHIGYVLESEERPEGLWVKAQIDLDDLADPKSKAAKVYRLLKGRRVTQFSFAYDIVEGGWVEQKANGVDSSYYELRRLKLFEVGPTLIGANQQTELLDVKSGDRPVRISIDGATPEDSAAIRQAVKTAFDPAGTKAATAPAAARLDGLKQIEALVKELLGSTDTSTTSDDEKAEPPARSADSEEPEGAKDVQPTQPSPASLRLRAELAALASGLTLTD